MNDGHSDDHLPIERSTEEPSGEGAEGCSSRATAKTPLQVESLARTSICEIDQLGDDVVLRIGRVSLTLSPMELAALSGSCRSATRRLFPRRARPQTPYLRLVTE